MGKKSTINDCLEKDIFYGKIKLFYYTIIISC